LKKVQRKSTKRAFIAVFVIPPVMKTGSSVMYRHPKTNANNFISALLMLENTKVYI